MNNAEDYIPNDEYKSLSSDDFLKLSNRDKSNNLDIDELHQLLGVTSIPEANDLEAMINTEKETPSVEDENVVSALEELEELYGVSVETKTDATEATLATGESTTENLSDSNSLMEEIEALYSTSSEAETDNTNAGVQTEESIHEDASDNVSLMEELEELFSTTESSVDDVATLSQASKPSSSEEDASSISALDELRDFLGDTVQSEAEESVEPFSISQLEHSFVSQRSVLEELQNLLQSCIDELKVTAGDTIRNTPAPTEVEYPDRDELQNLLETVLSQLMLISDSSASTATINGVSALDELKHLMQETGGDADKTETSILSAESDSLFTDDIFNITNENETNEYEVSYNSEGVAVDDNAADSILDELNLLLDEPDSEALVSSSENNYKMAGIPDESPALDELATYMAELSEETGVDDITSVEKTNTDSIDTVLTRDSNTLEELEAMLDEISMASNDKTSEEINVSKVYSSYEHETKLSSAEYKEGKTEENRELYNKVQSFKAAVDETDADSPAASASVEDVNLLHKPDSNNRIPITSLLFSSVLAVGVYSFWSLLNTGDGTNNRSEKLQTTLIDKPVVVSGKPKISARPEQSVIQESEFVPGAVLEDRPGAFVSTEVDSIYDLLAKTETTSYVPMSNYESESLNIDSIETNIENNITQDQPIENIRIKPGNKSKDVITLQAEKFQQEDQENLDQLNRRMAEAEISIVRLQQEIKTVNQRDFSDPVRPASSVVPEKLHLSVKQEVIEQPDKKVSATEVRVKNRNLWSVHLSSYYGKPPPASELEYLGKAGISYEIKKAIVHKKVWYRVTVDEFSEYEKAKEYSDSIRKNVSRNDIWINRSQ